MLPDAMPPKSEADPLEKRTVGLPPSLWAACEGFAADSGEKLSEIYRRVFTLGMSAEKARLMADREYEIKEKILARLAAKEQGALEALAQLKATGTATQQPAIAAIEQWLSKG
jgi:hypothetical protein